jgi:hypothetical protein
VSVPVHTAQELGLRVQNTRDQHPRPDPSVLVGKTAYVMSLKMARRKL